MIGKVLLAIGVGVVAGAGVSAIASGMARADLDAEIDAGRRASGAAPVVVRRRVDAQIGGVLDGAGLTRATVDRLYGIARQVGVR